jgi:hypothetical protein
MLWKKVSRLLTGTVTVTFEFPVNEESHAKAQKRKERRVFNGKSKFSVPTTSTVG